MKTLSKEEYRNKVYGCWLGKNIGGTLGAPLEAMRKVMDLNYYTSDLSKGSLPNDDLDLQLVWLCAAERYGCSVNADILAEYWVSGITPNWAEYGVGKSNLRFGLQPPLSGGFQNAFKDSNGSWIRSELWACLMPGHPELAVRYAYEDSCVDHADEGLYAEVFTAAVESSAFVEKDLRKLIQIGLSYIPADCMIAKAIHCAMDCYESGITWKEARVRLLTEIPDSFGAQCKVFHRDQMENLDHLPEGPWGIDAPANIGIVVLAWLYGEGDFERSICIAAGCGEDADCTAATMGSIMGIIAGADHLPQKWIEPIGDTINTCSINLHCSMIQVPKDLNELTQRTCRLMPAFLNGYFDLFKEGEEISMMEEDLLFNQPRGPFMIREYDFLDSYPSRFETFRGENPIMKVQVTAEQGIMIRNGETRSFSIHAENVSGFIGSQLWLELHWILPEGWTVDSGEKSALFLNQYHCGTGNAYARVQITAGEIREPKTVIILEVTAHDRPGRIYIPISLVACLHE